MEINYIKKIETAISPNPKVAVHIKNCRNFVNGAKTGKIAFGGRIRINPYENNIYTQKMFGEHVV